MKKYFLHLNNETIGPFALEELKANHITPSTPVWFEGMKNWQYATDIPEVKSVLIATPPPIKSFNAIPPATRITHAEKPSTILGLSKNAFKMSASSEFVPICLINLKRLITDQTW